MLFQLFIFFCWKCDYLCSEFNNNIYGIGCTCFVTKSTYNSETCPWMFYITYFQADTSHHDRYRTKVHINRWSLHWYSLSSNPWLSEYCSRSFKCIWIHMSRNTPQNCNTWHFPFYKIRVARLSHGVLSRWQWSKICDVRIWVYWTAFL